MAKKQDSQQGQTAQRAPEARKEDKKDTKVIPAKPNPITRFVSYVEASRAELRKVTWPTAKETRKATIAVLSFVGIMAVILGLIDLGLSSLIKAILS